LAAMGDKFSLVVTRWQAAHITFLLGDITRSLELTEWVIRTSEEDSYAFWLALGRGLKGASLRVLGRPAEAVPLLREGVAGCDRIGSGILHTFFLGELAEACWRVGDRAGAWEALDRGQAHNDRLGQRVFEAELRRRRAMFLLDESADNAAAAEECLAAARAVARAQKGRVFELRAVVGTARLWLATGRPAVDARRLVEDAARTFAEGADSPDLAAAREFLATIP